MTKLATFALFISVKDPSTFQEAMNNQETDRLMGGLVEEIEFLHKNHTWELVELYEGKKAIEQMSEQDETFSIRKRRGKVQGSLSNQGVCIVEGGHLSLDFSSRRKTHFY